MRPRCDAYRVGRQALPAISRQFPVRAGQRTARRACARWARAKDGGDFADAAAKPVYGSLCGFAQMRYLPQYSPDLNPIENCFSKIKAAESALCLRAERIVLLISQPSPRFGKG
jgi:transposase